MSWTEKFAVGLAVLSGLLFFSFGVIVYETNQKYLKVFDELNHTKEKLNKISIELNYEKQLNEKNNTVFLKKQSSLLEKISLLEESINPQDSRWAKVKKVRDAVKTTIKEFNYKNFMNTINVTKYASAVVEWSEEYDVPVSLVLAMTRRESAFNPKAKSHAGAMGLIQIMPETAKEIAGDLGLRYYSMYKIRDNVRFGVYYIMRMLDEFEGDMNLALAAYNAGPTYVKKVISQEYKKYPEETIKYVQTILGTNETGYIKYYRDMGL